MKWNRPVLDQNLYNMGMKMTSTTFASTTVNVLPAITFVMALVFRLEKVNLRKFQCSQGHWNRHNSFRSYGYDSVQRPCLPNHKGWRSHEPP
ncbi:hypothetical protein AAZX31_03G051000 [Glycine max]|nr:hypothetical protein JHK87_006303 [Glycine soja]